MDPQYRARQNGFPTNRFSGCIGTEAEDVSTRGVEESEVVDELIRILVECLKEADVRTQEVMLRKFFFEIEKDVSMERFLVERIKQSRLNSLSESFEIPTRDRERITGMEMGSRDIDVSSASEEETSEKLERFKIKTIRIGEIVKVEEAG